MQEQIEQWDLGSGTWHRERVSETWRLAATPDGTQVDHRLSAIDVARLVGAKREPTSGEWFPPEFCYSHKTGVVLDLILPTVEFPWVPPFGAPALPGAQPLARGLRMASRPLALAHPQDRSPDGQPDSRLPPLPPGQWRFVVDKFGLACPSLMAVEPQQGQLLLLLPETKRWTALEREAGASWGLRLHNPRGWRMELVHDRGHSIAYCPSSMGLAAITPNAIGLGHAVEHTGDSAAIGGPVAWGGAVWLPVLGKGNTVRLLGKPDADGRPIVLPTQAPAPRHGFEAPAFDDMHVNWPCDEGQLVLRFDAHGHPQCHWIAWPEQVTPMFAMGWPFHATNGSFWQLCLASEAGDYGYVQMAKAGGDVAPIDGLRLCTGRACYGAGSRLDGEPWALQGSDQASTDIVMPLLESAHDGAVLGLRMAAPGGLRALLRAENERQRAVLQVQVQGHEAVRFGTLDVRCPWLVQVFVHDGHLWAAHPGLSQPLGWKLAL